MEKTKKRKKSLLRRVLNGVSIVVMLALTGLLFFVVLSNASGNVTFIAGKTVAWVRTGSMEPVIPARSYILVEEVNPRDLVEGDIIMFRSTDPTLGGAFNTHRIIGTDDRGWFITKGDNNDKEDEKRVNPIAVRGRYVKNLPALSKVGAFLSTPAGITTLIVLILAITAAAFSPDIIAGMKDKEKEKKQSEMDALVRAEVERMKKDASKAPLPAEKDLQEAEQTDREGPAPSPDDKKED